LPYLPEEEGVPPPTIKNTTRSSINVFKRGCKNSPFPVRAIFMHTFLSIFFFIISWSVILCPVSAAAQKNNSVNLVLESAEEFFLSLKDHNFILSWQLLTKKSRETIIRDVYKASRKMGGETSKEDIVRDFQSSGVISVSYWNAFLDSFDPDMVLKESLWEIGFVKNDKAEIVITHRKSREPAVLRISREDGIWKVGLVETFWTRKFL